MRIQLQLFTLLLNGSGQLWVLDDMWTQVGVLTGIAARTSDSSWSQLYVSVSLFVTVISYDIFLTTFVFFSI